VSVSVRRMENERFQLSIDGHEVILDGPSYRALVEDMTAILRTPDGRGSDDETRDFLLNIRRGSDVGIQALLRVAEHDDVLALLKASEKDERAHTKLFANMGEVSRKIFVEDVSFRYAKGVPAGEINNAIHRLGTTIREIEKEGTPVFI